MTFRVTDLMIYAVPDAPAMSTSSNCCKLCTSKSCSKTKKVTLELSANDLAAFETQMAAALATHSLTAA